MTEIIKLTTVQEEVQESVMESAKLIDKYLPKVIDFGIKVLFALLILFLGRYLIRFLVRLADRFLKKVNTDEGIARFLLSFLKVFMYIVLIITLCNTVGVGTASFIALLGSGGVAIGLAMQGALSNLAGGVTILLVKPFIVGDFIIEEMNNGVEGTVSRIDLFYTRLTTVDNKVILIPNGTLTSSRIINVTSNNKRRVDFKVGISYKSNIDSARDVMWDVINAYEPILKDDEIRVVVSELEPSQVIMEAQVWVATEDYLKTKFYLNETMKNCLDEAGIVIPYNQLDVHLVKEE